MCGNINDKRIEKGVQYIVVGFLYTVFAGASFYTNIIISDLYYFSLLMLYSGSAGNLFVGIAITTNGFLHIKKKPLKEMTWYKLGLALIGCSCLLFIYGIISVVGIELESNLAYIIANSVFIVLVLPVFIGGFIFFFSGLRMYRKYRTAVQ